MHAFEEIKTIRQIILSNYLSIDHNHILYWYWYMTSYASLKWLIIYTHYTLVLDDHHRCIIEDAYGTNGCQESIGFYYMYIYAYFCIYLY